MLAKSDYTHFVNPATGNDSNSGSEASPWATWAKVCSSLPAGGKCVMASGVYRELGTLGASGTSAVARSEVHADFDGSIFGTLGGPVTITASDNELTSTRANCLQINTRLYWDFHHIQFLWGTGLPVTVGAAGGACRFFDCDIVSSGRLLQLNAASLGCEFHRCFFDANANQRFFDGNPQTVQAGWVWDHCIFGAGLANGTLNLTPGGGPTLVSNCDFLGGAVFGNTIATTVPGQELIVENCRSMFNMTFQSAAAAGANSVIENRNLCLGTFTRTNVATGADSIQAVRPLIQRVAGPRWAHFSGMEVGTMSVDRRDYQYNLKLSGAPNTIGALARQAHSLVSGPAIRVPALRSIRRGINLEAGSRTLKAHVLASGSVTNQPRLFVDLGRGIAAASAVATNAQAGEDILLAVTPTSDGLVFFGIDNLDPTVDVDVTALGEQ